VGTHVKLKKKRMRLVKKQRGRCYYCRAKMIEGSNVVSDLTASLDHITPRTSKMRNQYSDLKNTVAACRGCNTERGNTSFFVFTFNKLRPS